MSANETVSVDGVSPLAEPAGKNRTSTIPEPSAALDKTVRALRFAEELKARLEQFSKLVPLDSNPDLTDWFLQEQVRDMVACLVYPCQLLSGTVSAPGVQARSPLISGIIYNPQPGPVLFRRGRFAVVNPATCLGVVQVKPSTCNIAKLQMRLWHIAESYFHRARPGIVMGAVVSDANPAGKSVIRRGGFTARAYDYTNPRMCPVFILFSRHKGVYEPYLPGIRGLIGNIKRLVESGR